MKFRPISVCQKTLDVILILIAALINGDPELTTPDGLTYTFNGIGEATLIECRDPVLANVTIQCRMALPQGVVVATSFQVYSNITIQFLYSFVLICMSTLVLETP